MSKIEKVLVTGKTHTTLSAAGNTSRGHNGNLDIELSSPGNTKPAHRHPSAPDRRATVRRRLVGLLHRRRWPGSQRIQGGAAGRRVRGY
jgi:hypothetical protein